MDYSMPKSDINNLLKLYGFKYSYLMLIDTVTRVQILDEADGISHRTNTLVKGMNLIILPPAMGK